MRPIALVLLAPVLLALIAPVAIAPVAIALVPILLALSALRGLLAAERGFAEVAIAVTRWTPRD